MNGQTTTLKHLSTSVTAAHGVVGDEPTVTLTCSETNPPRVAVVHLTPAEARDLAEQLTALAGFVAGDKPATTARAKPSLPPPSMKAADDASDASGKLVPSDASSAKTVTRQG